MKIGRILVFFLFWVINVNVFRFGEVALQFDFSISKKQCWLAFVIALSRLERSESRRGWPGNGPIHCRIGWNLADGARYVHV